jgi:hypothetical protein
MTGCRQKGTTLVVGLLLLAIVTLLGLAGAVSAHIERQLAQNEQFRENAATAASAGIEYAIRRIVTLSPLDTAVDVAPSITGTELPGSPERFETVARFMGFDEALPQVPGARLAGAHFEITSTGYSGHAVDRQRATIMLVVTATGSESPADCAPVTDTQCRALSELVRLSWQRLPPPTP